MTSPTPAEVTRSWLMSYMATQIKERKGLGPVTHYQNVLIFFR
jgi:hypothetical protein